MAERRSLNPSHLSGLPPVSGAIPVPIPQILLPPLQCAMSAAAPAAMAEGVDATRQMKRRKKHREEMEVAASSSESPRPPTTPDSKAESPPAVTAETLTSTAVAAGKGRKRKKQEVASSSSLVEEAVRKEERKKGKRSKHEAAAATPSPTIPAVAAATAQILEMAAEGAAARKEQRRGKLKQGQSGQQPSPVYVHPQGGEAVVGGGVSGSKSVRRSSSGKPRVLTNKEILRMKIAWLKEHPLPQRFVPTMVDPNSVDQDPKYSSPFGAFFDQFCYRPERRQGRNAPSFPKTPDPPARLPPRDHQGAAARKEQRWEQRRGNLEEGQSGQQPSLVGVHPQGGEAIVDGGVTGSKSVRRSSSSKPQVLTNKEILRMGIAVSEEQPLPQRFVPTMVDPDYVDQDPKYSSPFGAFFDQFCYRPERRQGRNAPSFPKTPDPPARLPPRDHQGAAARKEQRREQRWDNLEEGQSGQQPSLVGVHPQGGEAIVDGGVCGSKSVRRSSSSKPQVLTNKEILRMGIAVSKEQPLPQGFVPAMANPNSVDQDPKYSSPFGAFFDQFCYRPERRQGRNAPSLPKTPDPPAMPPPRDYPSFLSSQLTANQKANKTMTLNTKRPPSASGLQEAVKAKEKKRPDKKMGMMKKPGKKAQMLSAAEKRSDKYRRLPLDQLVPPLRSPHNLLQERYAHDPWKVIVICMLLNVSRGDQVRKKLDGFFERYPDAQTACTADPEKMAEYLAPLGLQRVKANRIQKLSKAYVEEEWTYITELCGVGKYAADAYAIFCAGRAAEVVPKDHKLVDYWKYVCSELPTQNAEEAAGATGQGNFAPAVQQMVVSC